MPRRLPSSALDSQTILTASSTGAVLAANWYIGTGGLGAGATGPSQVVGTLNGPLTGTADSAKVLTPGKALNGTNFTGSDAITVPLNTTSIATSGTYYPTFVPSNTAGNQQASTHASLSYDPNTGYLNATRFVGSGEGLTGVVKSISFNGATAVSGDLSINQSTYGLSAVAANGSLPNLRLYSSSTAGAVYTFSTSTYTSISRIVVGLGALDAGETALRAVFYATNPATGQPYGDLDGNGSVGNGDAEVILAITVNANAATSRSNQLLAAIAASADIGLIVRYGWINSSLANDITFFALNGISIARSGNTMVFNVANPVAQVQTDWNATTGLATILNKPALFDGNYNSLSGIPAAPVTSVNGSTGAVTVSTLFDSFNASSYVNVQQMYKSFTIQPGGYLGDKFASTGLQGITGITINNFFSNGNVDAESGAFSYTVSFSITYSNAWFETYAPGYNPSHLRMVIVRQGDFAYGTHWEGYPTTTTWNINCSNPFHATTQSLSGFPIANMTSTTNVTWTTTDGGGVSGRGYSPWIWPSSLKLTTYYAR